MNLQLYTIISLFPNQNLNKIHTKIVSVKPQVAAVSN